MTNPFSTLHDYVDALLIIGMVISGVRWLWGRNLDYTQLQRDVKEIKENHLPHLQGNQSRMEKILTRICIHLGIDLE